MVSSDIDRIREMGYREFVGGDGLYWDEIANLQFNFLRSEGLKPKHILLDIACGCLRAGRLFIEYLNAGNYLGIEKEVNLIIYGVSEEVGMPIFVEKYPFFVVSSNFEFEKFPIQPDYAIAQSILTHLSSEDVYRCLKSLRNFVNSRVILYATFFEAFSKVDNPPFSDSIDCFFYTREQMNTIAEISGWYMEYVGDWGHPRDQKLIKLIAK